MSENTICLIVVGRERPGLVAAVTGVLFDSDCNIRDSMMTILAGEFIMLFIVELPTNMASANLDQALSDVQRRFDLGVFIKRLNGEEVRYVQPPGTKKLAVTIYGGDRKGMLHHVALLMARKGVSIAEMKARVLSGIQGAGLISMKIIAPQELDLEAIRQQLNDVATRFGVEVVIG